MEADTKRYCPYFSPYTSYSPYLSLWVLNCLAISFAARIYYTCTCTCLKFKNRKTFLKTLPRSETTFFANASRTICREQLPRSTILSKLRSITAEPKYRPPRPHNALLGSTFVCPFVSQPATDFGIRIFASNFPKESVINETPDDIETLDGTKPDCNRDFAQSMLPRRDAVCKRVLYITPRVTLTSHINACFRAKQRTTGRALRSPEER